MAAFSLTCYFLVCLTCGHVLLITGTTVKPSSTFNNKPTTTTTTTTTASSNSSKTTTTTSLPIQATSTISSLSTNSISNSIQPTIVDETGTLSGMIASQTTSIPHSTHPPSSLSPENSPPSLAVTSTSLALSQPFQLSSSLDSMSTDDSSMQRNSEVLKTLASSSLTQFQSHVVTSSSLALVSSFQDFAPTSSSMFTGTLQTSEDIAAESSALTLQSLSLASHALSSVPPSVVSISSSATSLKFDQFSTSTSIVIQTVTSNLDITNNSVILSDTESFHYMSSNTFLMSSNVLLISGTSQNEQSNITRVLDSLSKDTFETISMNSTLPKVNPTHFLTGSFSLSETLSSTVESSKLIYDLKSIESSNILSSHSADATSTIQESSTVAIPTVPPESPHLSSITSSSIQSSTEPSANSSLTDPTYVQSIPSSESSVIQSTVSEGTTSVETSESLASSSVDVIGSSAVSEVTSSVVLVTSSTIEMMSSSKSVSSSIELTTSVLETSSIEVEVTSSSFYITSSILEITSSSVDKVTPTSDLTSSTMDVTSTITPVSSSITSSSLVITSTATSHPPASSVLLTSTSTPTAERKSKSLTSPGTAAAIAVCVIIVLVLAIAGGIFYYRRCYHAQRWVPGAVAFKKPWSFTNASFHDDENILIMPSPNR